MVFAGAKARLAAVDTTPSGAVRLREELRESGSLVPDGSGDSLLLTMEHEFSSPSAAAAVLLGRSAAGPLEWKNGNGMALKQLREEAVGETTT
jgi:hypothetical protein